MGPPTLFPPSLPHIGRDSGAVTTAQFQYCQIGHGSNHMRNRRFLARQAKKRLGISMPPESAHRQENSKPVRSPSNRSSIPFGMAKLRLYPCGHNYMANRMYVRSMFACMYINTGLRTALPISPLPVPSPPRLRTSEAMNLDTANSVLILF